MGQAMKAAVKTILIAAVIVMVAVVCGVVLTIRFEFGGQEEVTKDIRADGKMFAGGSNWPVFRGAPRLLGRASGALPDSLKVLWRFKTGGEVKSSPVIDDGLVFIGSNDGNIYAIDLYKGRKVWAYRTGGAVEASPCVVGGKVFVGSSDSFMYALDARTGELNWKYETGGKILGAANWASTGDGSNTLLVFGSYDGKVHCVDCTNGKAVWSYETDNYVNGTPAIGDGKAIVGGCDAMIHVISLSDGSGTGQIDAEAYIAASAAIFGKEAYVGNYAGLFLRADIDTGEIVWKYIEEDSPFFSSPAIGENVVIFGGRDNRLHCVNRSDGKVVWMFQALGEIDSSPVICGDKVIVGSEDGRLYMLRLSDGGKVWSYEVGQPITSSPAIANGMVVIGCDDGYVYAFDTGR